MSHLPQNLCWPAFLALALVAALASAADPFALPGEEEGASEYDVRLVDQDTEGLHEDYRKAVDAALAELPEGTRLRLETTWLHAPDHNQARTLLRSIVPVDEQGRKHGVETVRRRQWWPHYVVRQTTWRHGVKHGLERLTGGEGKYVYKHITWVEGQIQGDVKTFHPDGRLQGLSAHRDGELHGRALTFDPEGRLIRELHHQRGRRHGDMVDYWPDSDQVQRRVPYVAGAVHGVAHEYYQNGQLKRLQTFRDNTLHGREVQYEADGTVIRERWWLDGRQVDEETFRAAADE